MSNALDYAPARHRPEAVVLTESENLHRDFPGPKIDVEAFERAITESRLNKIATLIRQLTYGEMIEFAAQLWAVRMNAAPPWELEEKHLPGMFHRWSQK